MNRHWTTALARALLVALLAVAGLTACRGDDTTSQPAGSPVQVEPSAPADTPSEVTPHPGLEPVAPPATDPADACAYEGDPACGWYPDEPVAGVCTPDYAGDVACRTNEDLLNDTADLYSDRINNSGW
jgi:hypothetical protein